jgi:5'-3' exonuclease
MANLQDVFHNMSFDADDTRGMHYNSRVLLVDGTNTFMRAWCAVPSMDDNGRHIGAITGFLKSLGLAIRTFKPTRCVVVFDGKGGSQRRRKIYPQYKANRKPPIRLNRAYDMTTDEEEKENMKWQLVTLIELLECLPVTILALDNVEADDVIGYLSQLVTGKGGESIIYSMDKDFLQLASENVKIYSPIKKKTFTVETILEDYGIHPKHFYFYRALNGDKSDNIDGVRGVGETTVKKLLPEVADPTVDLSLDYIHQKFAGQKKIPKMIENILANKDIVERNMQLMNLHEGIMSVDARMRVANIFESHTVDFQKYTLTKLMLSYRLLQSIPNYDSWVSQSFMPLNRFKESYDATV